MNEYIQFTDKVMRADPAALFGDSFEMPTLVRDKAKIIRKDFPLDFVMFDLNPKDIAVRYTNTYKSFGTTGNYQTQLGVQARTSGSAPERTPISASGPQLVKISFTGLFDNDYAGVMDLNPVTDDSVRRRCDLLGAWTRPSSMAGAGIIGAALGGMAANAIAGAADALTTANLTQMPPLLILQWGEPFNGGFFVEGHLENVSIKYIRFSAGGNPTRAEAACTFAQVPNSAINKLTNPTSGGLPGRRAHVVAAGENLQTIATAVYGRPGAWRAIAEVNGIDDPMRLPPGTTVYLPNSSELDG